MREKLEKQRSGWLKVHVAVDIDSKRLLSLEVTEEDTSDSKVFDAMRSLNVPRNVAALIIYLANVGKATSKEIEKGTSMRQPEVSLGMRALRQNNWVNERDSKVEGKSRPIKVYKLSVPIEKIMQHYEEVKSSEAARTVQVIQMLKDLTAT